MASIRVTMEVGGDGVAIITLCNPPVNALHPKSMFPFLFVYLSVFVDLTCFSILIIFPRFAASWLTILLIDTLVHICL